MYYVNSADVSSFLLFLPHTCRISADRKRSSWVKGKFTLKKKKNRNQDVLFFSSDCNKQQLYADTLGCGGRWPSSLLAQQFISSGSVYILRPCGPMAKQTVNYCGCSTFPLINISANHGHSPLKRHKEATREASSEPFMLNTVYLLTHNLQQHHQCGILHNHILCLCSLSLQSL